MEWDYILSNSVFNHSKRRDSHVFIDCTSFI